MSNVRHLHVRLSANVYPAGTLVTLHGLPYVVVRHAGDGMADLYPGDDLFRVTALGRVLAHVSTLVPRVVEHYVTVEPVAPDDPQHYVPSWEVPPRLCIAEHRTGWPTQSWGTEGFVPLASMRQQARRVALRLGVEFREPVDELAVELLGAGA